MNPHQTLTRYAGFDRAKDHRDIIVIDIHGRIIADFCIEHTPGGWLLWNGKVAA